MTGDPVPPDVHRFLLTSALSVPHIETILLMRREPNASWSAAALATRLYVAEKRAERVLAELVELGIVEPDAGGVGHFLYRPKTDELAELIGRLDAAYSKHLVEVTRIVHAARDRAAEEFAAAFRFRKEP